MTRRTRGDKPRAVEMKWALRGGIYLGRGEKGDWFPILTGQQTLVRGPLSDEMYRLLVHLTQMSRVLGAWDLANQFSQEDGFHSAVFVASTWYTYRCVFRICQTLSEHLFRRFPLASKTTTNIALCILITQSEVCGTNNKYTWGLFVNILCNIKLPSYCTFHAYSGWAGSSA